MRTSKILLCSFILIGFSLNTNGAWGQSSTLSLEAAKEESIKEAPKETVVIKKDAERIQVTGSHLKRIEIEGPSPVQTITRKELDKSGYNSVSDVLRETGANSFGSARESSGGNAPGVAHVNLRGLGSSNTLVLLNGQRLPTDAITGAVDLNLIPMAAVERVEVLKDGASAIYGSDALGGVVNVITRKDFNGSEVSISNSVPELEGGGKREINLVNGISRGRFNMVNVVQYRNNEKVNSRDREWTDKGFSNIGSPGSYRTATGWKADPNCPAEQVYNTPNGSFCRFKYSDFSTELPQLEQLSLLTESNYELSSRVRLTARAGATQRLVKWSYAPSPDQFAIPAAVADTLGPGGTPLPGATPGQDLTVRYRIKELGTRDTENQVYSYNMLLGSEIRLTDSWEFSVNASHNRVQGHDEGVNGYALKKQIISAISTGRFNPFAPEGQRGSLDFARYNPLEETTSELSSADLKLAGEVGETSSGPIGLALGSAFTFQKYRDHFDEQSVAGEVFGNAGSSGGGQRDTKALFSEVSVPLSEKLEMQIAGRYDQYSDFGDTFNPKAALKYKATDNILLRTSVGTGFKAPLMQDLYAATSEGYPSFIDYVACDKEKKAGGATPSCAPQQYLVTSSGNNGLKEEKSVSYNMGAVIQAKRNLSFGADVFMTRLNNVVGIDYEEMTKAELQGIDLAGKGISVKRVNGYIDQIEAPLQNLSAQEISGVDLSANYVVGKFSLGTEHSQLFYFKEEGFPGTGLRNKLGENGRPVYRNVASLGFQPSERHNLALSGLTTGRHEKAVKDMGNLRSYTQLDMQYSYTNKKLGVMTAGIKNLMGTTPPIDDSNPTRPLNVGLYEQIGRQFYTSYKATF